MDFELSGSAWHTLRSDVVANDDCTAQQAEVAEARLKRGPLEARWAERLEARRSRLAKRFGSSPDPRFFIEVLPADPEEEMQAGEERRCRELAEAAAAREALEAEGALLTVFPVQGKWSATKLHKNLMITESRAVARLAELSEHSARRARPGAPRRARQARLQAELGERCELMALNKQMLPFLADVLLAGPAATCDE